MPKGHPVPAWFEVATANLDKEKAPVRRLPRAISMNLSDYHYDIIMRAAASRGLSIGSFFRRAVIAFACKELGLDWYEVMEDEPRVREFGASVNRNAPQLKGTGYGLWIIDKLRAK